MNNKITLNSNSQTQLSWEKIQADLKYKFGNDIYDSWLRKITFEEEFNNYILLKLCLSPKKIVVKFCIVLEVVLLLMLCLTYL